MNKYLPLAVITSIILAGCTHTPATSINRTKPFADSEVYQGYPCQENCEAFKKGYDQAKERELTDHTSCSGDSLEETTGCRAYVQDHKASQQPDFYIIN